MLRTTRLYLRNICHTDVDTLFDYRNDSRCYQHQRYEDTSRAYLQEFVRNYSHSSFLSEEEEQHYAIVRNTGTDVTMNLRADSTCAYRFENARYVLHGKPVQMRRRKLPQYISYRGNATASA